MPGNWDGSPKRDARRESESRGDKAAALPLHACRPQSRQGPWGNLRAPEAQATGLAADRKSAESFRRHPEASCQLQLAAQRGSQGSRESATTQVAGAHRPQPVGADDDIYSRRPRGAARVYSKLLVEENKKNVGDKIESRGTG